MNVNNLFLAASLLANAEIPWQPRSRGRKHTRKHNGTTKAKRKAQKLARRRNRGKK